nr:retrovirus-related Pol polyprotein from transposon TNT 1-94 [Tanacetum cinerariifolium]
MKEFSCVIRQKNLENTVNHPQDESIDSDFARFNTIITSLKTLDEGYSSKNYVRKFLRAVYPKWRAMVTPIEESKDLTSLSLDELTGNLKVHEMIIKKDSEIVKEKVEMKSLALKAKCGDPNHLLENVKNHRKTRTKEHLSKVLGVSGEEDDEKVNNETCLVAQASSEICLGVNLEPDEWIKDSGCSKHMTGNRKLFSSYKAYNRGNVIFGSNIRGNTIGKEIDEIVNIKESRNHPLEKVIGNLNQRTLRSQAQNQINFFCFISTIEPKNVNEALGDKSWIGAMQEELNQFIANDDWELVPQPRNMIIIGTKWVFSNKLDENGIVSQNKARLVAQGYNQQEGIDYDETYAPIARLELIRILLAYACALNFKLLQMDVKSSFLNDFINEDVYVA